MCYNIHMINIIVKEDIDIKIDGNKIEISQKKLRAIIAFFAVERVCSRTTVADVFFNGKKNNIRNSVYLINKAVKSDFIVNIDRNTIGLNPRFDIHVEKEGATLKNIVLKNEAFNIWKESLDKTRKYYIHNNLLTNTLFTLKNSENNCIIYGDSGTGKTEFTLRVVDEIDFAKTIFLECNKQEQHFSLNILFSILKNLQNYITNDILKVFNDFTYNNFEAFKDDNNLLNLHYIPIGQLIVKSIEKEINENFIIVIDDIEYIDKASYNIIRKIIENGKSKLKFVFTTSKQNLEFENTKKISLSNWSKSQLSEYIETSFTSLNSHISEIYSLTNGNPLKVKEYINKHSNNSNNELDYLTSIQKNIVSFCSCFNRSLPVTYIKNIFFVDNSIIDELIKYNIIYLRMVDNSEHVFFVHRTLKKRVYSNLSKEQLHQYHLVIANYLEQSRTRGNIVEVNEIYYHYSKTYSITKQIEYRIKYLSIVSSYIYSVFPLTNRFDFVTDNSSYKYNVEDEISQIEKDIFSNVILSTNLEVLIDYYTLKNRYSVITGKYEGVMESILKHIECCKRFKDDEELLKSYYIMIYYGLNFGSTELISKYLKKIDKIAPLKTNAIAKRIEGYNLALQNNFDKAIFVINEAIELSSNLPKEIAEANLVACYAYLGEIYIVTKNYKRGLKDLMRGKRIIDDSVHFISGSIIIDLYSAICYYHTSDKKAFKLIEKVCEQYDKNQLCWKRSLCYIYYGIITHRKNQAQDKLKQSRIKYHNIYEKSLYNKFV